MTRSTRVAITSAGLDPMTVWRVMATALMAPEQYRYRVTATSISADLGQGLDAAMDLKFSADGNEVPASGCDEYCLTECDGTWCWEPAHFLMADFDTAYGATLSCGCHSGGIHIRLVSALGSWLDQQGATWRWYDESGAGWDHGSDWGALAGHREACPTHAALPAPAAVAR